MPNDADSPSDDVTLPSDEVASGVDYEEIRTLLAELSQVFSESDAEQHDEVIEPNPSSATLQPEFSRSSARRRAIAAYAAAAGLVAEPAAVSDPPSFAWILKDRSGRVEAAASHSDIAEPPGAMAEQPPTHRVETETSPAKDAPTPPDSAFGQRFRARRRTRGRGCAVR